MKKQIIELGYYHPSNANWSYHIFMIIDETGARMYRSTFGGDSRIVDKFNLERLHAGKGSQPEYKWKEIKDLLDVEYYAGRNYGGNRCLKCDRELMPDVGNYCDNHK